MADYPIPGVGNDFTTQNFTTQARQLSSESLRPAGMGNASADLSTTLRSFRDSLAFSFQTLNLTLNSLNNSVRTVGTKLGATDIHLYNQSQYLRTSAGINAIGTGAEVGAGLAGTLLGGPAIARAIGFGSSRMAGLMLGGPVGMLAGTVVGAVADPMIRVAQEHNRDVAALQRMSARFSTGGFSTRQAQQAITGIEDLAYNEIFNTNSLQPRLNMSGFRELTNMGLQGGLFHGTNPDDLVKQVSAAANVVKFLTGVMGNKDVQETMQLVKQMKDMGVNLFHANNFAMGLGTDAFKYGRAMGINPSDMMNMAANMSTVAFGQYGNPAYVGMQPAMRNLAYMQELEKRDFYTKNIVKKYLKNPEGMLDYIEQHGTPVYRIDNADVLLDFIKEEEGLILPKKGFKALYLNVLLAVFGKKKLTLKMSAGDMFILRNMPVNVYSMLHQFHKWMSFKMNLPGCEDETQSLMRDMMYNRTGSGELSIDEIMALKDAIARDREAIDFVINLAKETEGAKNAMKKLKDDGSANI